MRPRATGHAASFAALLVASCRPPIAPAPQPCPAPPVSVRADPLDGGRWLARDAALASSLGAGPLQLIAVDVATEGDRVGRFVSIAPDTCLLAYARGSSGVEDVDLAAYADDGTTIAADEASDPHPSVMLCPPHPERAYLAARVASGRGIVAIGAQSVSPAAAAAVERALAARGRPGEARARVDAWPGLDERIAEHRRALGGATWEEARRVAVPADPRAPALVSAMLRGGRCLDAFVVPGDEVGQLDVTARDGDGRIVARGQAQGRSRAVVLCSPLDVAVSLEIRPHGGQGLCAVVLAESAPTSSRAIEGAVDVRVLAPTTDLATARERRAATLRALGYDAARTAGSGTAEIGRRSAHTVDLAEGCSRIDVVAGEPAAGITAAAWSDAGLLLAEDDRGDGPSLVVCGKSGKARIDLEATVRSGPFALEVRRERRAPAAFVAHPLAASRLVGTLEQGAGPVPVSALDPRVVALEPASLSSFDLGVADGRCVDVAVALDRGGAGVELRVVGSAGGEERVRATGLRAASVRVCADGGPRALRAELRLSSGKADALVLTRDVPLVPPR